MNHTPETDAEVALKLHGNDMLVRVSFARKLERERDQLRARVAALERIVADIECGGGDEAGLASLVARLHVAEEDKARLDWLDRNAILRCRTLAVMERGHDDEPLRWAGVEWDGHTETIRAAIDAARKDQT